jgi:PKD repeat protein
LIGAGSPSGSWDVDTAMSPNAVVDGVESYTATGAFAAGGEWKFRAAGAWDLNLGGDLATLTVNGGNLKYTDAGTYKVTLKFDGANWSATSEKQ